MDEKMKEALKTVLENLTDEQKEVAKECKDLDELFAYLGKEGIEIPDDLVDMVAGGVQAGDVLQRIVKDVCEPVMEHVYYF